MWNVITPTFALEIHVCMLIKVLKELNTVVVVRQLAATDYAKQLYSSTYSVTHIHAHTEAFYLVSVLPFLYILHVQHVADYLEEFLDTR